MCRLADITGVWFLLLSLAQPRPLILWLSSTEDLGGTWQPNVPFGRPGFSIADQLCRQICLEPFNGTSCVWDSGYSVTLETRRLNIQVPLSHEFFLFYFENDIPRYICTPCQPALDLTFPTGRTYTSALGHSSGYIWPLFSFLFGKIQQFESQTQH